MFTSGFFNGINHDRLYDALQVSQLFDGLIRDGIFASIGTCMVVTPNHDYTVNVGIGRAWFNHTWSYNDSIMPVDLPPSEVLMDRIDAVVLEINNSTSVRQNSIKVLKGTPGTNPQKPALTKSLYVNQYPLAYIRQPEGSREVEARFIENCVGTAACPLVTGILNVVDLDTLLPQWKAQLDYFITSNQDKFTGWANGVMKNTQIWLNELRDKLGAEPATRLQLQIDSAVELMFRYYENIQEGTADFRNGLIVENNNNDTINTKITKPNANQVVFSQTIEPKSGKLNYTRTVTTTNATSTHGYLVDEKYTVSLRAPEDIVLNLKPYVGSTDIFAEINGQLYDVVNVKKSATEANVYNVILDD